jgi:hypothetical protein
LVAGLAAWADRHFISHHLPTHFTTMTDKEVNFWNMSKAVHKLLQEARPQWEPLYKKMLPAYTLLDTALGGLGTKLQKLPARAVRATPTKRIRRKFERWTRPCPL